MGNEFKGERGHSADYFGDTRDHWWNRDYLQLLSQRWGLAGVRDALDVGCGVGHWGMLLAEQLPADARVTGVDRESVWVEKAVERAEARGLAGRFRYVQGAAEALPFADDSFDLVTCQTVLIHVPDADAALAEMIRVTRPGGIVVACEPNNLAGSLSLDEDSMAAPVSEVLSMVTLQLVCERGKAALGEGDNSVGQLLPARFVEHGLVDLQVYLNDRANPVTPPYATPSQRAEVEELIDFSERAFGMWSHDETRRYYLAGGGSEEDFTGHWAMALGRLDRTVTAIRAGRYRSGGGALGYCISGRKPQR